MSDNTKLYFMKDYPRGFNDGREYHDGKSTPIIGSIARYASVVVEYKYVEDDCFKLR